VTSTVGRLPVDPPTRPLASSRPILFVVLVGAAAIAAAIASILRHPGIPALIAEDYMRVAGGVLVPDVRATDPFALAESLRARQASLAARVPALTDAGYELAGGAVRPIDDRPGIIAIYRNRPLDLVVFHAYHGRVSELLGTPEVREDRGRVYAVHRKSTNILVFWQEGPIVMVLTSSLPVEQVLKLAYTAAAPIARAAAGD
jgi:anti-sigma factor RsiW